MKLVRVLNIKGALLDKYQLENYLEKIASDHILEEKSSKDTYPIPRLQENFDFITKTYDILNHHIKMGITIHPAGEWLLDNYYILEEMTKTIQKDLNLKKYRSFPGIATGPYQGFARIYVLATEIVAYTDSKIDSHTLQDLLKAYQNKKTLDMEEIWNIGTFLDISLMENIRMICEKIYSSQMQRFRVENILERLVEYKAKEEQKYKMVDNYKTKITEAGQMKYPFIEHMSYRLKGYGKKAAAYLSILEEQVDKMGMSVTEVIQKEHFDIAVKKVLIGNCIKSIKDLQRINFLEIFEKINGVEEILKKDPAGIYERMDYKTKEYYRNSIKEIAKKTKIAELYITKKALELAEKKQKEKQSEKQIHIGYYLISEGIQELYTVLQTNKKVHEWKTWKSHFYVGSIVVISFVISVLLAYTIQKQTNTGIGIITLLLVYIPITQLVVEVLQYILNKIVKPQLIPKMDYAGGIPKQQTTMVIIPTIVKSQEKVKDLISKLEVFYLANKSENLYFTLLADTTSEPQETLEEDEKIKMAGIEEIKRLNAKYPQEGIGKFQFIYRKREWNEKENCYLGWERKRGLINQFNEYLLGNIQDVFYANTIEKEEKEIPQIKYIITLDADTNLILNSALELVGAAAHILNTPELNKTKDKVISGHALIQPRIGIDLESVRKSIFTKVFAGAGGIDSYTNAISDTYQDNFEEGIFTGKGIYDLRVFSTVLHNEIPENTVLSHDLLEGNYLRCALASDILLLDGYPYQYQAFIQRLHRWIRGDWQITRWLNKKIKDRKGNTKPNPLNFLSKYKILDNLRRSLVEIMILISILWLSTLKVKMGINILPVITIILITSIFSFLLEMITYLVHKQSGNPKQHYFAKIISGSKAILLRGIISFAILPHKAYISMNAIVKTCYRNWISKKHLLEWTTAEEAERQAKKDILSYYCFMFANVIAALITCCFTMYFNSLIGRILGYSISILWLIAPWMACVISKPIIEQAKVTKLNANEIEYLIDVAKRTWEFFHTYMDKENHYLPPDNYQEGRNNKIVNRTSSTNIGLGILSIISACDLGFITEEETVQKLENTLATVIELEKWNGHLYNWYDTKTLKPLNPRYISTVDSGNFVGYLYVAKEFLDKIIQRKEKENHNLEKLRYLKNEIEKLINVTDFSVLYDYQKRLFSIGFNIEDNKLTDCYYDLLASEARQASLIAIAKKDIPSKHWQNLSRTLTIMNHYKGLVSWSGTAFEYLMPNINIRKYPGSLLDESCNFMLMSQKQYAKKLGIPWGISESAFHLKDLNSNYQYKAFGIPWLGLKRGLADEMVVSSYGSILALPDHPKEVLENMKELEKVGMLEKYGFYEAVDYTPTRLPKGQKYAVVKTYMAHHQGLILLSINNLINSNILQERFIENPEIKAVDILLQERMPEDVIITKERKEKIEKLETIDYENYTTRVITKVNNELNNYNVIANENYTVCMNEKGEGFSKYKDIMVNRYKQTNQNGQGIFFYIKNIRNKKIWQSGYPNGSIKPDKYEVNFLPDMCKIIRTDENITTTCKIITTPGEPVEIRSLELKNTGTIEETLEITSLFEPVLSIKEQDYAHMTFNNLFLKYEYEEETNSILVTRNKRGESQEYFLGVNLLATEDTVGELEYEIDGEKINGGVGYGIPKAIENSIPFSKTLGLTVAPVVALKRRIKIKPKQKVELHLIITVSEYKEEVIQNLKKYTNTENTKRAFELSKVKVEEETRYLGIKGKDIENYQKLLSYLILQNPLKKLYLPTVSKKKFEQKDLWQYGISGERPILLVKVKDANDIDGIKEILKAYEFFRIKNILIDLVILNGEENVYEKYVKEAIEIEIGNRHLSYLMGMDGGIFLLNENEIENKELFEFRANVIINAHNGTMQTIIKELEEEYLDSSKKIGKQKQQTKPLPKIERVNNTFDMEKLKYYNEYGGFSEDGQEYKIKVNKTQKLPTIWTHIIANEKFGTLVTQNLGGFTWYENSRLNRISTWSNDILQDSSSEIIYLQDEEYQETWSLNANLAKGEEDFYVTYGFGYANYKMRKLGLIQELDVFVPRKESVKINLLRIKNTLPEKRNLKLVYYIKPTLGEDETKTNGFIDVKHDENKNIIYAENKMLSDIIASKCFVSCSEKIVSFTGNKKGFFGAGTIEDPESLYQVQLDNENALGQSACIAIEIKLELKAYEDKEIAILLGSGNSKEEMEKVAYQYTKTLICKEEKQEVINQWREMIRTIQVKTPIESTNILLNGWLLYQTVVCRLWAKSAFYQSGGAMGFRDQLQDSLAVKFIEPEMMRTQILKHARHQFLEGDVEHWWHEETGKGIRTKFSDDLLWLPYVTAEYIKVTKDIEILEEQIPYLEGEILQENEDERYDKYKETEQKASLYEHCMKAIDKGINLGEHGLPKIGSGDWNDGFSTVGNKGIGESVWLGFFLYEVLTRFIPLCKEKRQEDKVTYYEEVKQKLKKALNTIAWDGRWYKRAFMDDGQVLGTIENEECKIDSIAQSWSVISGAGDNDKKYISMENLQNYLIDTENGIIKLLDPPFEKSSLEPGYIKAYLPGVRENGGQYTHAAVWAIMAIAKLGFGDKAFEYYRMINPIEHARTKEAANKYKVEPYVIAADIYGTQNLKGRGGWTWYTGSSSWMYQLGIETILGFTIKDQILSIQPCIPKEWKEYSIRYQYQTSSYQIKVKNPNGKNTGVEKFMVNGEEIAEKQIKLIDNAKIYEIEIIM